MFLVNLLTLLGAFLGIFVSISSVGASAIGVTVLLMLYPRLPLVRVVGADIAHAVPLTLVAGIGHWLLGTTNMSLLPSLLVGSMPGIVLSSYFANRVPAAGSNARSCRRPPCRLELRPSDRPRTSCDEVPPPRYLASERSPTGSSGADREVFLWKDSSPLRIDLHRTS